MSEEIQVFTHMTKEAMGETSHTQFDADDEVELPTSQLFLLSESAKVSDSESDFSTQSFNDFLPLPWHDRLDLTMQMMEKPTEVEISRWTKIALVKSCKAFGVNAAGVEHDILGIILRMEERRKAQLLLQQQQAKAVASPKRGRIKGKQNLRNWLGVFKKAVAERLGAGLTNLILHEGQNPKLECARPK